MYHLCMTQEQYKGYDITITVGTDGIGALAPGHQ